MADEKNKKKWFMGGDIVDDSMHKSAIALEIIQMKKHQK